jgi:hypothetical protein
MTKGADGSPRRGAGNSNGATPADGKKAKRGAPAKRAKSNGIPIRKHLEAVRVAELKDVHAFWAGGDPPQGTKKELVERVSALMAEEGTVYRRVRTLTRKVLDVLLLLLRREHFASDLPGLFQRLPGEDAVQLEYHEAEAGIKALIRRGFLAEVSDKGLHGNGRKIFTVPEELGTLLTALFREETRTVGSVFRLGEHAATITAKEREGLRREHPELPVSPGPKDAAIVMGEGGAPALFKRLPKSLQGVVQHILKRHWGVCTRAGWSKREKLKSVRWDREAWSGELERHGVGTVARMSLKNYGIALDDDVFAIFEELLADHVARLAEPELEADEVLRAGCDIVADLGGYLRYIRRNPVRLSRDGAVYKAGRRKIQSGFVFQESVLAGPAEIWLFVHRAAEHLGLVGPDGEGFLELSASADSYRDLPLEEKTQELHRLALEQPGPRGRSLHQHELRTIVSDLLREHPERWWRGRSLAAMARHRYLATLDERGIKDRHRDRFFSAYFSGRETVEDLLGELHGHWLTQLYMLGMLDIAIAKERPVACRLSALGARVLGAEQPNLETGLEPIVVNPDFEILVLPEGDVTDVVHTLDGWAQRVKSGNVTHFQLTRDAVEAAVGRGRDVEEFVSFLQARARGDVPQNVLYSIRSWAGGVSFATLEKGVLLRAGDEAALDRILAVPEMRELLAARLAPDMAFLKAAPTDKKLLATLREKGVELQPK